MTRRRRKLRVPDNRRGWRCADCNARLANDEEHRVMIAADGSVYCVDCGWAKSSRTQPRKAPNRLYGRREKDLGLGG